MTDAPWAKLALAEAKDIVALLNGQRLRAQNVVTLEWEEFKKGMAVKGPRSVAYKWQGHVGLKEKFHGQPVPENMDQAVLGKENDTGH